MLVPVSVSGSGLGIEVKVEVGFAFGRWFDEKIDRWSNDRPISLLKI